MYNWYQIYTINYIEIVFMPKQSIYLMLNFTATRQICCFQTCYYELRAIWSVDFLGLSVILLGKIFMAKKISF